MAKKTLRNAVKTRVEQRTRYIFFTLCFLKFDHKWWQKRLAKKGFVLWLYIFTTITVLFQFFYTVGDRNCKINQLVYL